nr:hypothetical protein [Tanacetum cinerariifolium]
MYGFAKEDFGKEQAGGGSQQKKGGKEYADSAESRTQNSSLVMSGQIG